MRKTKTSASRSSSRSSRNAVRVQKIAPQASRSATNMVPQGGLFWDGRADTLQDQALLAACSIRARWTAARSTWSPANCSARPTRARFTAAVRQRRCGPITRLAVSEALFAVARYQIEDAELSSLYQQVRFLAGRQSALYATAKLRGYALFNDPAKANCAGCHVDQPTRDGLPPLFTDHQFEALGRAAQYRACRQRRSGVLRSRHLRALSDATWRPTRNIAGCS